MLHWGPKRVQFSASSLGVPVIDLSERSTECFSSALFLLIAALNLSKMFFFQCAEDLLWCFCRYLAWCTKMSLCVPSVSRPSAVNVLAEDDFCDQGRVLPQPQLFCQCCVLKCTATKYGGRSIEHCGSVTTTILGCFIDTTSAPWWWRQRLKRRWTCTWLARRIIPETDIFILAAVRTSNLTCLPRFPFFGRAVTTYGWEEEGY
jgi:hypothetical protein